MSQIHEGYITKDNVFVFPQENIATEKTCNFENQSTLWMNLLPTDMILWISDHMKIQALVPLRPKNLKWISTVVVSHAQFEFALCAVFIAILLMSIVMMASHTCDHHHSTASQCKRH